MRSERALPTRCPACTPLPAQSKNTFMSVRKTHLCSKKQNTSSTNNGLNHSVITSHAKQDLIKMAAGSQVSSLFIGKQGRWERGGQRWTEEQKVWTQKGYPLLWRGRIHFARWFGFKSAGTNLWHEVILCWSFSPKFIHQLFTVNADCISVGNYEGWVFSLRQKECDTADTPNLMCRSQCPRSVREGRIIYVLETVCSGKGKGRHIILNLS